MRNNTVLEKDPLLFKVALHLLNEEREGKILRQIDRMREQRTAFKNSSVIVVEFSPI